MIRLAALLWLALIGAAVAQTYPTPTYNWVNLNPQSGTPSSSANGTCWTQSDGLHCYYGGAAHGPFIPSGGTIGLTVGSTTIASGTSTRVLYDNAGVLGEYTNTQLTALINSFSSSLSGSAPASGGGSTNFLRADGTWAVPPGTGTSPGGSSGNVQFNNAGAFGGLTDTQLTTHINAFSSTLSGAAPASGGGSSNFLRADGTWAVPPGTSTGTVSTTGTPASGNLTKFTGAATISNGDLSGDATTSGTLAVTVAKINGATLGTVTATSGNDLVANGTQWVSVSTSGDCTRASSGAITCTKTNGSNFAASATTDTTNASNISSGTLAAARGGAGTISGALKGSGAGVVSQAACADLSNGATGCSTATGTSGATIPLLNGTNTWSGVQSFNSGDVALKGATSGSITLNAAATAGSNTITLPAGTTNFSATGGSNQVVQQTSSGGAFTVGQLSCSSLSGVATSCSTDATNASNISSGTLNVARLPTNIVDNKCVTFDSTTSVTAQTITFPVPWTSYTVDHMMSGVNGGGSFTVNAKIGSTSITSLSAVSVSGTSNTNTSATGANTGSANDLINLVITAPSGTVNQAWVCLYFQHSAN